MVISHKYRFIFIKTRKTAGTSIEVFLSRVCGDDDVFTPIRPHVEPHVARNHAGLFNPLPEIVQRPASAVTTLRQLRARKKFYNHIPAWRVKARIPFTVWNNYFKFCVERNPWDKTLSHYHMLRNRSGEDMTLDEYFQLGSWCRNYYQYADRHGRLLVDRVVKYENLNEDLDTLFSMLGVPFDGALGVMAKSGHRSNRAHYSEALSRRQRDVITGVFQDELQLHGYTF